MATLYELTGSYHKLLELSEDTDPTLFSDTMDSITDAIEDKAVGYAKVDKELDKDEKALKDEASRLSARAKSISNNRKILKQNLQEAMETTGKTKIKTNEFTIYIQNNAPSVRIPDESLIPAYLTKTVVAPDKTRIKQLLKEGKDVPGAELSTSSSLRIR
ncbi:siphovirus Gp157 family protein [Companilactobacillus halodurans]|uniref:Siphovirus Gp157 family protein n=1 Tax=Companilactobacillus halodurans TaxID=2584183 RepID=A0A5P0ZVT4_9LACO|nr:siphovirus Gp157 family protein [Companilactobacillus halodurans]MQS97015.1 siphovirus Gp157 family protein [Companilactobacillus halodurans]